MALSISTILAAVKTTISTPVNASTLPLNIYDTITALDSPQLDALLIYANPGEDGQYVHYRGTFGPRSVCTIGLRLELRVGGSPVDAVKNVNLYLSSGNAESIADALEADATLGGAVGTATTAGFSVPTWFQSTAVGDARTWLSSYADLTIKKQR